MAKSKLVQVNEKITETVTEGFRKIEDGVVGGYRRLRMASSAGTRGLRTALWTASAK